MKKIVWSLNTLSYTFIMVVLIDLNWAIFFQFLLFLLFFYHLHLNFSSNISPIIFLLSRSFHLLAANFNLHFVSLHGIRTRVIKTPVLNDTSPKSTILNEHSPKVYKP